MPKLLQDIWIIDESGIVVFHRVFDEKVDAQLFGGLMSALNSFAEQLSKGGLSNFELRKKRFSVINENHFLFIASSSKDVNLKKVDQELRIIAKKFFDLYPKEVLSKSNGEISKFRDFKKEIENSLEDTIRKFRKAFW